MLIPYMHQGRILYLGMVLFPGLQGGHVGLLHAPHSLDSTPAFSY